MKEIPLTQGKCIDCSNPVLKISQKPSKRCSGCLIKRKRELAKVSSKKYRESHRDRVLKVGREYMAKIRRERPMEYHLKDRKAALIKNYGITEDEYNHLFSQQGGNCAICGSKNTTKNGYLCIDHDHETGKVRGLLCNRCNVALGLVNDSRSILEKMIIYTSGAGL